MENDTVVQFRSLCPVATGLDVFGDKWTLLILRDMLFLHKSTFNEFKAAPELMPSKMLSNRLKKLESLGYLSRKKGEVNKKNVHYLLEEKGMETFPIMVEIALFTTDFYYDHLGDTYTEVVKTRMKNDKDNYINEMIESYKSFKESLVI
ncbi:winged helix-turn-helix transcriptional regulator [Aquirufa lenticrescens]|uniref:winged helix-turn-helix transcriptional regulator n=1 Tax=Aquirufa lenticrescens TaxID=2696560 RepID=UPI001CAA47BE|nr:helix-turn-helix domain-containing protein [Aquirufa lenticrescens]UAJ14091.1 helix-turn-helix transcriptional regulator [Aquirufa lenticrescens]